ncbi:MAG TPA: CHAT domain-containing protein, partial [Bryobacteraceae bacterium]|nr:CHAT domain-containing protein [Bryobacteraceae bacterium]
MPEESLTLLVPGTAASRIPDAELQRFLKIRPLSGHDIVAPRRGESTPISRVEGPPDAIVRLEYASGLVEYLRLDQLHFEIGSARSAAGALRTPPALERGAAAGRGITDWILKTLDVFEIHPVDALAEESAEAIVRKFDHKLDTGLFRLDANGAFQEKIAQPLPEDPRPCLVFIHGTASSTQGSFSGFWRDERGNGPTPEWRNLVETYGDRIFALEHATLGASPAQNAYDLAALLPAKARLHLITHSRGGLVGELLGLGPLNADERKPFERRPDADALDLLAAELERKSLRVEKFVRAACPAAGTVLASGRLDVYLNVLLNLIGLVPGLKENPFYDVFKASAITLIKMRADPAKIPGIEAQMPESPFVHLLNTRGRTSDADLGIIAGAFQGAGVWSALASYALRAYYWEDNDFVVNTKSMSGGMDRKRKVQQFLDSGSTVNHFSYFKNASTRSKMLEWLNAPPGADVEGFDKVRGLITQGRGGTRGAGNWPAAVIVPDVFGTHLERADGMKIWLNYAALGRGALRELAAGTLQAGEALEVYQPLFDELSKTYRTLVFPYDWRQSVKTNAEALEKWLGPQQASGSLEFIGHGMGGLIVRQWAADHPGKWAQLTGAGGKLLMLGTPNGGSWRIARILAGRSRLSRMAALLGRHTDQETARIFQSMAGLIDLLPEAMLDPEARAWDAIGARPSSEALAASRRWRQELKSRQIPTGSILYVAGSAAVTPVGMDDFSAEGDGDVVHALGLLPGARTWYNCGAAHGDLIANPAPLVELLKKAATSAFDSKFHPSLAAPIDRERLLAQETAVFFPSERDLQNAALARTETVAARTAVLRVKITHGHLRDARHPVIVGHYAGDGIVSAEAALDRQLGGRLSARFHMDLYPGTPGTVEIVRAPGCHPAGAIVIGLGEVGEITAAKVRQGVLEACLQYALMKADDPRQDNAASSASVSSLLIGASGGRAISIPASVAAVARGVLEANRVLRRSATAGACVEELEFVEIYEDAAIEAAKAVSALDEVLKNDLEPGEAIEFDGRLRALSSGLSRRSVNEYDTGWWRRILIEGGSADEAQPVGTLSFDNLTDRARAENARTQYQTSLIDSLLEGATSRTSYDPAAAAALFELLVPNVLKDQSADEANLVLVVDAAASRYPWELMAARSRGQIEPLAVRMGMIRQLKTLDFRVRPSAARDRNALVIGDSAPGDPAHALPPLKGAQQEARIVSDLLNRSGYLNQPLICRPPDEIVPALFAQDYRILHLAGHGLYNAQNPARSGMILKWSGDPARQVFLTSMEVKKLPKVPELVFLNCCHLGAMDLSPHRFAASVAEELIKIGVKAVVAAGWAVDDAAAVAFARSFYGWMLAGGKFGEAVKRARQDAFALGNNNTWGAYQCYGNPDFALQPRPARPETRSFYARRECIEELKDICAESQGADGNRIARLKARLAAVESALGSYWRDGESLFELAEALKCTGDFERALELYHEAIRQEKAYAPVRAIEQSANVLDRLANA